MSYLSVIYYQAVRIVIRLKYWAIFREGYTEGMIHFNRSLFASAYYRIVGAASALLRGKRGSVILVSILGLLRSVQSALGCTPTNSLIDAHLQRIFPSGDTNWRKRVIRGYWKRHQSTMVALFRTNRMVPSCLDECLEYSGRELLDEAVSSGRGVMLLVPHFGDEKTLHILLAMSGYKISVISSRYLDTPPFVQRAKLRVGQRWHHVGFPDENPGWMFKTLARGEILHIAPTGYGGPRGTWINNFGVPVLASSSPYRIQRHTGCRMLIAYNRILPGMRYRIELEPFEPNTDSSDFTQRLYNRFEEKARKMPRQYNWKHLLIRHRETNTISRIGFIPRDERELEIQAIPEDSDTKKIADISELNGL
jgi:lauroyl/myristoyl acyltransferase